MRLRRNWIAGLTLAAACGTAPAALTFTPAPGYTATPVWSGANGAHFAVDNGGFYVYGKESAGANEYQNTVRFFDGTATVEIARSPIYSGSEYSPDAITAVGGAVYWAHARSFASADVYRTAFTGGIWTTEKVLDASAGVTVYGLSTDGTRVFGTGLNGGDSIAFILDNPGHCRILVSGLETYSGGSGFDPAGNFYAGGVDTGFAAHTYRFTAQQVADRVGGARATPYAVVEAVNAYAVPNNGTPVMENDGSHLFGQQYKSDWSGTDPFAYNLAGGATRLLGSLSGGAPYNVTTDMYSRDGGLYFMGKSDWVSGAEAAIYRLVPEPGTLAFLCLGILGLRRGAVRRCCAALALAPAVAGASEFAVEIVAYAPAPGQFVNHPYYNDPTAALSAPVGGGTDAPDNSSLVSLGGFGGSIVLRFEHVVADDPRNPFGMDAIVFGNATWVDGNPNRHWAECGTVEIARDANGNGLADDPWYVIPGSHITDPAAQWQTRIWDDNITDPTYPPASAAWLPPGRSGVWSTSGYRLPPTVFDRTVVENPNGLAATDEGIFGYADFTPTMVLGDTDGDNLRDDFTITPDTFYTFPDDPLTVGITLGSGGGNAFDIAWAIDPATGQPARLTGFDFLRITNGVNHIAGILGELSPEIDAVADVRPGLFGDTDWDGDVDLTDYGALTGCIGGPGGGPVVGICRVLDSEPDGDVDAADYAVFQEAFTP